MPRIRADAVIDAQGNKSKDPHSTSSSGVNGTVGFTVRARVPHQKAWPLNLSKGAQTRPKNGRSRHPRDLYRLQWRNNQIALSIQQRQKSWLRNRSADRRTGAREPEMPLNPMLRHRPLSPLSPGDQDSQAHVFDEVSLGKKALPIKRADLSLMSGFPCPAELRWSAYGRGVINQRGVD